MGNQPSSGAAPAASGGQTIEWVQGSDPQRTAWLKRLLAAFSDPTINGSVYSHLDNAPRDFGEVHERFRKEFGRLVILRVSEDWQTVRNNHAESTERALIDFDSLLSALTTMMPSTMAVIMSMVQRTGKLQPLRGSAQFYEVQPQLVHPNEELFDYEAKYKDLNKTGADGKPARKLLPFRARGEYGRGAGHEIKILPPGAAKPRPAPVAEPRPAAPAAKATAARPVVLADVSAIEAQTSPGTAFGFVDCQVASRDVIVLTWPAGWAELNAAPGSPAWPSTALTFFRSSGTSNRKFAVTGGWLPFAGFWEEPDKGFVLGYLVKINYVPWPEWRSEACAASDCKAAFRDVKMNNRITASWQDVVSYFPEFWQLRLSASVIDAEDGKNWLDRAGMSKQRQWVLSHAWDAAAKRFVDAAAPFGDIPLPSFDTCPMLLSEGDEDVLRSSAQGMVDLQKRFAAINDRLAAVGCLVIRNEAVGQPIADIMYERENVTLVRKKA